VPYGKVQLPSLASLALITQGYETQIGTAITHNARARDCFNDAAYYSTFMYVGRSTINKTGSAEGKYTFHCIIFHIGMKISYQTVYMLKINIMLSRIHVYDVICSAFKGLYMSMILATFGFTIHEARAS